MHTIEDFWALVDRTGPCWPWTGDHATTQGGYVHLSWSCLPDGYIHRTAWILANGPIPPGLTIDHRCFDQPTCCNVAHMELVPQGENTRRRRNHGLCKKGHTLTPDNTWSNGRSRVCKECRREYQARRRARSRS